MKKLFLIIMFSLLFSTTTMAAELLMVHSPICVFCKAFMREVAPDYNDSKQGKVFPLRVLDLSVAEDREWLKQEMHDGTIKRIMGTPTFIIYDNGKEIDRFVGYGGKEWFYHYLDETIKRSVQQ